MNGREKSDPAIVARKLPNGAGQPAEEAVERRACPWHEQGAGAEGNAGQHRTPPDADSGARDPGAGPRARSSKAKEEGTVHRTPPPCQSRHPAGGVLRAAAQSGTGRRWGDVAGLRGGSRATARRSACTGPPRSVPTPSVPLQVHTEGGRKATAAGDRRSGGQDCPGRHRHVLNAIYEEDFLGFSYGFRPGRGPHDALDAAVVGIAGRKVNWILDADIRSFFDSVNQEWLIRFVEHRVGDKRIVRLIRKWLKAGILEDGVVAVSDRGTGQGSVITP